MLLSLSKDKAKEGVVELQASLHANDGGNTSQYMESEVRAVSVFHEQPSSKVILDPVDHSILGDLLEFIRAEVPRSFTPSMDDLIPTVLLRTENKSTWHSAIPLHIHFINTYEAGLLCF
jgi:hypothetical protein